MQGSNNYPLSVLTRMVTISILLSVTTLLGCGGSGSSGDDNSGVSNSQLSDNGLSDNTVSQTGDVTTEDPNDLPQSMQGEWTSVRVLTLEQSGLLSVRTKTVIDTEQNPHFFYFLEDDERGYSILHRVWDIANQQFIENDAEKVVSIDNNADLAVAMDSDNTLYTAYRGGLPRECNGEVQSDAMFSEKSFSEESFSEEISAEYQNQGSWIEHTAAIGLVERNPVLPDGLAGDDLSITIDSEGAMHMAYQFHYEGCDAMNNRYPDLRYVKKSAGMFDTDAVEQTIDGNDYENNNTQSNAGNHNTIILDDQELPIIFYYAELLNGEKGLRVAWQENNEWLSEWIETDCEVGDISAVLADNGSLAVAYYVTQCNNLNMDMHTLRFATKVFNQSANAWHVTTVDDTTKVGNYCSLALDANGFPAIAYYELESYSGHQLNNLKLARYDGMRWQSERVAETGDIGLYNTLWFDREGAVYITTFSNSNKTIYLYSGQYNGQ